MKKLSIYTMTFLAITTFVACDEDFKDWVAPQTNPQEDAVDVTFQVGNASSATFDLNEITAETIEIAKQSSLDLEEGSTVTYTLKIDSDAEFSNKLAAYELSENSGAYHMATSDLQDAIVALFGKRPEPRALKARINAYVKKADGFAFMAQSNVLDITATPIAPVIEPAYYITGDVTGGWGEPYIAKFNHSGKDVYEDAVFTLIIDNPANEANFKIIPEPGIGGSVDDFWASALGTAVDGDDSTEGTLLPGNPGAIQIAKAGWTRITLDMMAYTYKIEPLTVSPYMWVPGNHQSWDPTNAPQLYTTTMDLIYTGHMYLDGGFKLTGQADWAPTEYGYSYFSTFSENITDGGGGNMSVDPGYYFIRVNLNTNAIEATLTQWSIIGDATPGGWDNDTAMSYDGTSDTWNVTVDLVAGNLKFRANNDWAINMGGSFDKLLFNEGNLSISDAGNYTMTLHLGNDDNSYCVVSKN